MSKPGRPRALDAVKLREICAFLSAGAGIRQAARYVGCSASTIHREAQRNEEFREQLRRAGAAAQLLPLQAMRQAAQTHWRAAAWMLERGDPERFGRRNPKAFGPQEARALGRDLLAIFNDEIDHPILQERVAARVEATIRYAMRHAWDRQRTGDPLRRAMEFFAQKDGADGAPDPFAFASQEFLRPDATTTDPGIATPSESSFAKPAPFCDAPNGETTGGAAPTENHQTQNP